MAQAAPNVVYVTRHAEKTGADKDPALTAQGAARARMLAALLHRADIRYVFSSDTRRTRQTAQPLAERVKLNVEVYDAARPAPAIERIKALGGPTLLVGHSNTVPDLVRMLGGAPVAPIGDDEYDRLYQVSIHDNGTVSTVLLSSSASAP
ncbi:histidine phosphatase family protein [Massilia sp. PAMC28688]|nr:histidine phosphatase family protein [Massilia sp. PAMC28688]